MTSTDGADTRDEHGSDPAFERLRAADPAADLAPDLAGLRATVGAAVGTGAPETAAARRRPSARWFQLAAASAGVLAVGLGGYALGERGAEAPPQADEQVETAVGPGPADGGSGTADSRAVAPEGAAASADKMIAPGWGGRTTFDSVGLDDAPSRARAWAYDPAAVFSDATVARLGAALGVSGAPELTYGSWRVGSADWTGPVVELSPDSQASFYYSDPALNPWSEDGAVGDAPTVEAATDLLTGVMATLGIDSAGFEIESLDEMQSPGARTVTAYHLVDGQRSGARWDVTATTAGIFSLNGQLAPLVDLGEYDVVGAQTAVARLQDPRFGAVGGDMIAYARADQGVQTGVPEPVPSLETTLTPDEAEPGAAGTSTDIATADPADPAAVPSLPATPQPGTVFAWPVTHVTITGATLTTSTFYQPDGGAVILPAYTFTDGSGSQWTTIAVADAHLDFTDLG